MLNGMEILKTPRTNEDGSVREGLRDSLKCADHIINNCVMTGMDAARNALGGLDGPNSASAGMLVHRIFDVLCKIVTHFKARAKEELLIKTLKSPGVRIFLIGYLSLI